MAISSSVVVVLLLATTSLQAVRNSQQYNEAQTAVQEWLDDSDYDTISIVVSFPTVTVTVAGSGELPPVEELAQELSRNMGSDVFVLLRKMIREKESYPEIVAP